MGSSEETSRRRNQPTFQTHCHALDSLALLNHVILKPACLSQILPKLIANRESARKKLRIELFECDPWVVAEQNAPFALLVLQLEIEFFTEKRKGRDRCP